MLSWLAITYNTARLGLEAQHAAAFPLQSATSNIEQAEL
jgi:hypothetical protein